MGTRENKVETHLRNRIKSLGGDTRKWVSPGHIGVPDQIVFVFKSVFLVEVKTSKGKFKPGQEREHRRLRELGATVCTVWGQKGVEQLIRDLVLFKQPTVAFYG